MKISDGFDARRLRPKGPRNWRTRFGAAIAALLATCGVLLILAGIASLIGHPPALGDLNASPAGAAVVVVIGLFTLYIGVWLWRRSRRRLNRNSALNMSPHLMKKHD
jgi:membrane protein implicated in regulation of membrane protease activity